jgi:hypothetical protein
MFFRTAGEHPAVYYFTTKEINAFKQTKEINEGNKGAVLLELI